MAKEIKTYTAEVFLKEKHTLGESPFYDVRTKTLSWVDITEGKFLRSDRTASGEFLATVRKSFLRFRLKSLVAFKSDTKISNFICFRFRKLIQLTCYYTPIGV